MRSRSPAQAASLAALSAAGLAAGHVLDYRFLIPNHASRLSVLAHTGHANLGTALHASLIVGAIALVALFGAGLSRGLTRRSTGAPNPWWVVRRVALLQAIGFVALEAGERLVAGARLFDLAGPLLGVGIVIQIAVGATGGLTLILAYKAGIRVGRVVLAFRSALLGARPRRTRRTGRTGVANQWRRTPRLTRGPPVLLPN
jgi:hypothetical protein